MLEASILLPLVAAFLGLRVIQKISAQRQFCCWSFALAAGVALIALYLQPIKPMHQQAFSAEQLFIHYRPYLIFVYCFIGLLCCGMSSLRDCSAQSYRSILLSTVSAIGFSLFYSQPLLAIVFWLSPSLLIGIQLRKGSASSSSSDFRVFTFYQGFSGLALMTGMALLQLEQHSLGVVFVLLAVFLRSGIFPFHSWVLTIFEALPIGVSLAYFAPQLCVPLLLSLLSGDHAGFLREAIALGGVCTAVYGALLALVPFEGRRALAYLFISQTGLVLFGLMSDSALGLTAALVTWMALSLSLSGFAAIYGCLEARKGPLTLATPSGCYVRTPLMATAFLLSGLASVGIPGTVLYLSEDLLFQSALEKLPVKAILLIIATTLCAINVMRLYLYLFGGTGKHQGEQDFTPRELSVVCGLFLLLAIGSLIPSILFQ